ncbi:MAG TPA: cytochrome P450 [Gemmatimonadota bacterium]|nr:cytochrome P450 [Gemmatimonadota bacterium]
MRSGPHAVDLPRHVRRTLGPLAPRRVALDARVRLGPLSSTWFLTHPDDIQHVLVGGAANYEKTPLLTSPRGRRRAGGGLLTSRGEEHLRQRRLLQPLFHREAVERYGSVIDDRVEAWLGAIRPGAEIDLAAEMADLTKRIILTILFGDDLTAEAEDRLARAIRERRRYTEYVYHGRLPWRDRLPTRILRANRRAVRVIDAEVFGILARRRARAGTDRAAEGDLIDGLLSVTYADGASMTDAQIRDEVLTFTSTGYETLGEALTWTWYRLALHPEIEAGFLEAIEEEGGAGALAPATADHAERIMAEAMRLHPPTWVFARVPRDDDILPRGGAVGARDTLLLCQYVMHRHPAFFPDPERFDPGRFAGARPSRWAYLPFGDGAHKCIGEHLARLEGARVLVRVARRIRFRLLAPERVEPLGGITLRPRGGLPARVEARVGHARERRSPGRRTSGEGTILHAAIHKSGNLWLSRILREVTRRAGWEHRSWVQRQPIHPVARTWRLSYSGQADMDFLRIRPDGCYWRISDVHQERIDDLEEYVRRCTLVWSHEPIIPRSVEVLPLFDRIVYLIRDPRDIAVSLSRFVFTPHVLRNWPPHYEEDPGTFLKHALDGELRDWVAHVGSWLRIRPRIPFHVVFYERLLHDFDAELRGLVDYLEIELPDAELDAIRDAVSFGSMHGADPDHVRKGRSGQWVEALSPGQRAHSVRVAGEMLELLGYPTGAEGTVDGRSEPLPSLPARLDPERLAQAIARAQRGPWDEAKRVVGFAFGDRSLKVKANRVRVWSRGLLSGRSR